MAYHTWQDALVFLDSSVYTTPDAEALQLLVKTVESIFENEVRGRVSLPISEDDSPDTYEQAKQACAMRTAALYARQQNQAEGNEAMAWYPGWLEDKADKLVEQLASPHLGPGDREEPLKPFSYLPSDGKTSATRPAAIFKRANITSGTGTHW